MVCENDILEIPEEYIKMSEEELDKEIERLYETMKDQNRGEVREKVAKLPVKIFCKDCCLGLIRAGAVIILSVPFLLFP